VREWLEARAASATSFILVAAGMKKGFVAAVIVLAGCATTPDGPGVMVLPGSTRSFDQFRADDGECRQYASAQIAGKGGGNEGTTVQQRYDFAYQQCMYARGHQIPVARGSFPRQTGAKTVPPPPPPPPAGTPPPPPSGYRVN
jgi:hypothetical protein